MRPNRESIQTSGHVVSPLLPLQPVLMKNTGGDDIPPHSIIEIVPGSLTTNMLDAALYGKDIVVEVKRIESLSDTCAKMFAASGAVEILSEKKAYGFVGPILPLKVTTGSLGDIVGPIEGAFYASSDSDVKKYLLFHKDYATNLFLAKEQAGCCKWVQSVQDVYLDEVNGLCIEYQNLLVCDVEDLYPDCIPATDCAVY